MNKSNLTVLLVALPLAGFAAPPKSAATNAVPPYRSESAFLIPSNPKEGRDPFYPNCTSLYQTAVVVAPHVTDFSLFKVTGLSGTAFAQINGTTLQVGDTAEVKTKAGTFASIRLIEIRAADDSVVIEVNGQRRVLSSR